MYLCLYCPSIKRLCCIVSVLAVVSLCGCGGNSGKQEPPKDSVVSVKVAQLPMREFNSYYSVYGYVADSNVVKVIAKVAGEVEDIVGYKGSVRDKNDVFLRINPYTKKHTRESTHALLMQRTVEYNTEKELFDKGHSSPARLRGAEASYRAAQAHYEDSLTAYEDTFVKMPIKGLLDDVFVKQGDYVSFGEHVANVVRDDKLLFTAYLSEREARKVHIGDAVDIKLSDGTILKGTLKFVASVADNVIHTYKAEAECPFAFDTKLRVGDSVEININLGSVNAYLIPFSAIVLQNNSDMGVYVVNEESKTVSFAAINLISYEAEGYIRAVLKRDTGDDIKIVTYGSLLLSEGEKVDY